MLRVSNLHAGYGDLGVLWGVDFDVAEGEMVALIGSNGAGKTTFLKAISGVVPASGGEIEFLGQSLMGRKPHQVVQAGIAQVPEGRRLFRGMTVEENLGMGAHLRSDRRRIQQDLERVFSYFPVLKERRKQLGGKLSGGEQQMCAIGRTLMSAPKLIMVDELSLGLAPMLVESLMGILKQLNRDGLTIITVEQDVQSVLDISDRGFVMERGRIELTGKSQDLLAMGSIKSAYLGI